MAEEETVTVADNTDDAEIATPDTAQAADETSTEDVVAETTDEQKEETAEVAEKPKVDLKQRKIAKQARDIREMKRQNAQLSEAVRMQAETASQAQSTGKAPKIEEFESMDAYLDARDSYRDSSREPAAKQEPDYNPRDDLFDAGTEKYEDFEDVVFGGDVRISSGMADAIFEIDDMNLQADVAYFLGQNPRESAKISKLSERRQVAEIAKLEVKLSTKTSAKKQASKAPSPIKPVGGSKTSNGEYVEGESYEAYLTKWNKKHGRKSLI